MFYAPNIKERSFFNFDRYCHHRSYDNIIIPIDVGQIISRSGVLASAHIKMFIFLNYFKSMTFEQKLCVEACIVLLKVNKIIFKVSVKSTVNIAHRVTSIRYVKL